jgi:TRAP-type C4-dicarboxylate transport system permease small subunit
MKRFEKIVVIALFSALVILCVLQILFRFALNFSLSWTEELARFVFILLVYMAACAAVAENAHVRVEVIDRFLSKRQAKIMDTLADLIFIAFMGLIGWYGLHIAADAYEIKTLSPAMQMPMWIAYGIVPVTFGLTCLRLIQRIWLRFTAADPDDADDDDATATPAQDGQGG